MQVIKSLTKFMAGLYGNGVPVRYTYIACIVNKSKSSDG